MLSHLPGSISAVTAFVCFFSHKALSPMSSRLLLSGNTEKQCKVEDTVSERSNPLPKVTQLEAAQQKLELGLQSRGQPVAQKDR